MRLFYFSNGENQLNPRTQNVSQKGCYTFQDRALERLVHGGESMSVMDRTLFNVQEKRGSYERMEKGSRLVGAAGYLRGS